MAVSILYCDEWNANVDDDELVAACRFICL